MRTLGPPGTPWRELRRVVLQRACAAARVRLPPRALRPLCPLRPLSPRLEPAPRG
jgi:hypothetical protein